MRQKKSNFCIAHFLARFVIGIALVTLSIASVPETSADTPSVSAGFPADFVDLYVQKYGRFEDTGGKGAGQTLGGFGGLQDKTKAENKAAVKHTPVILIHGNGVHALHTAEERFVYFMPISIPTLGVWPIRDFLVNKPDDPYNDAEIWAISYLGTNPPPSEAEFGGNVRNNLPDVRKFIDMVIEYLGVDKVDIIAHSLGNNMAKGYLNGFQSDNSWDNAQDRLDKIGTYVSLTAAHYGAPAHPLKSSDTDQGSTFERGAHVFKGITDDTPYGALKDKQVSDNPAWIVQTALDEEAARGDHNTVIYVAMRSHQDFVDQPNNDTSHLAGANLNREFDQTNHGKSDPMNLEEHSRIITEKAVFDAYAPCLNGGGPSCPQGNGGTCYTATNDEHVASGRAEKTSWFFFTSYSARGSGDSLGWSGDATTSLKETKPGHWQKADSCPANG